ncbi:hypothetical protein [Nocardioides sp.]|uniref:phage tail protein n=1 Tax=Nocardioides sp. TaxID=35761 RepID=UPI002B2649B0|nr:hypothetical protein [Nocardioides sp.]
MAGPIRIAVLANASQASRELSSVGRSATSMGDTLKKAGKVALLGVAAAGAGAVVLGKSLIEAGERAGTSNARITQVATSMGLFGDQTQQVSNRLIKLAESQARATGIDQNAIKATQAKLLTFKELAKSADDVGGNFDRATTAAIDLASAGFGTAESNAAQLGKALNDPVKGLASLTKSGVTFTEAEKERIAVLVESGKAGQAQNKVLAAIEAQVGGTSVATANGTDKIRVAFSQLAERLGSVLVPIVDKAAAFIAEKLLPAAIKIGEELRARLVPVVDTVRNAFSTLLDKLKPVGEFLASNPEVVKGAAIALGIATVAVTALGIAFGILAVATSPITLIVVGIAALGAGLAYAYKNSETFRNGVHAVVETFKTFIATVAPIVQQIVAAVATKFQELLPQIQAVWASVQSIIKSALAIIKSVIATVTGVIKGIWQRFGATILRFITTTMTNVANLIKSVFKVIEGLFKVVSSALRGDWKGLWDGIKQIVTGALGIVKAIISQAWNVIRTVTSTAWTAIKAVVSKAWDSVKSAIRTGISAAVSLVKALPGKIVSALGNLASTLYSAGVDLIGGFLSGIKNKAGEIVSTIATFVTDKIPGFVKKALGIASPSKVFRKIGQQTIDGLLVGIGDRRDGVRRSLDEVTSLMTRTRLAPLNFAVVGAPSIDPTTGRYSSSSSRAHTPAADREQVVELRALRADIDTLNRTLIRLDSERERRAAQQTVAAARAFGQEVNKASAAGARGR